MDELVDRPLLDRGVRFEIFQRRADVLGALSAADEVDKAGDLLLDPSKALTSFAQVGISRPRQLSETLSNTSSPVMRRLLFALLSLALVLGVSRADAKYVPPPIAGHVTDAAGRLSPSEISALNEKLASYRKCSTNHVA